MWEMSKYIYNIITRPSIRYYFNLFFNVKIKSLLLKLEFYMEVYFPQNARVFIKIFKPHTSHLFYFNVVLCVTFQLFF